MAQKQFGVDGRFIMTITAGRLARLEKAIRMQRDRAAKIVLSFRAYYGDELSEVADACEGDRLFMTDFEDTNETSN